jgi:hypothetical protein
MKKQIKKSKETGRQDFANVQKVTEFLKKKNFSSLARATFLTTSCPRVSQNSLANLDLIAKTSSLGRSLAVL